MSDQLCIAVIVVTISLLSWGTQAGSGPVGDFFFDHLNQGNAYLREERYDLALSEYQQALSLNPDHMLADQATNNMINIYGKIGEVERASSLLAESLQRHPESPTLWDAACALELRKRIDGERVLRDESERACNRALLLKPDSLPSLLNLATLQILNGEPAEAEKTYRTALLYHGKDSQLRVRVSRLLYEYKQDKAAALREAQEAVALDPGNTETDQWLQFLESERMR